MRDNKRRIGHSYSYINQSVFFFFSSFFYMSVAYSAYWILGASMFQRIALSFLSRCSLHAESRYLKYFCNELNKENWLNAVTNRKM